MEFNDHSNKILDGRYRLEKLIGEGGMGSIYLGQHVVIGRQVAVKLLRVNFADNENIVRRFYREAQAASAIKHKNIIDIFDLGVAPWGEPYLVMEYLEGESLGSLLDRRGTIDLAATCGILEPVLRALAAAHKAWIVHRDLKPENIFLVHEKGGEPTVKIIDFGISKFLNEAGNIKLTQTGSMLGTPEFMSPEQARGQTDVDHRADIYATGVILYEALTGGRPFTGVNYNDLILNILTQPPRSPHDLNPQFPPEAVPIIMRCLKKDRDDRYQNAEEMLAALRELDVFSQRKKRLARLTRGANELSFASGDLGVNTITKPYDIATKVLNDLVHKNTLTKMIWAKNKGSIRRFGTYFFYMILLMTIAFGVAGAILLFYSEEDAPHKLKKEGQAASKKYAEKREEEDGILITVEGAPQGSKIFYKDALVPMNPFRVDKKKTIAPIRVEADGYETFSVAIVPSNDKIVKVTMKEKKAKTQSSKSRSGRVSFENTADQLPLESAEPSIGRSDGLIAVQQRLVYVRNKKQLKECYDQALSQGVASTDREISTTMELSVSESGNVLEVVLSNSGAAIPSLGKCIKSKVEEWVFPASSKETKARFSFSFSTDK